MPIQSSCRTQGALVTAGGSSAGPSGLNAADTSPAYRAWLRDTLASLRRRLAAAALARVVAAFAAGTPLTAADVGALTGWLLELPDAYSAEVSVHASAAVMAKHASDAATYAAHRNRAVTEA